MIKDEDIRMMLRKIREDEGLKREFAKTIGEVLPNYKKIENICEIMIERDEKLRDELRRRGIYPQRKFHFL